MKEIAMVVLGAALLLGVGFVAGVIVILWLVRDLRVTAQPEGESLLWVASPHGPLRAPTDEELEWARLHPGGQLPYIPGHAPSDPYMSGKGPAGSPGGPFETEKS